MTPTNLTQQSEQQPPNLFDESFLRRLESLSLVARRARVGQWQGERRSLKRGQSVEFADYREYVPGDDFRLIDWNAYARLERFFLKLFVEEEEQIVHLLIDTSRSMDWPKQTDEFELNKFAYARRAAAALGYIALAGLDRVILSGVDATLSHTFPPRRGRQQAFTLFNHLNSLSATGQTNLNQALSTYARQSRSPGMLFIFSDLFDAHAEDDQPAWQKGILALLSRRFEITIIHLLSPDETNPSLEGDLRLLDGETGTTVEITADYAALTRYKTGLEAWQNQLRQWCNQRSIVYLPLITDVPFEQLIFSFLRQRGVLH